jgi:hypothetical protein
MGTLYGGAMCVMRSSLQAVYKSNVVWWFNVYGAFNIFRQYLVTACIPCAGVFQQCVEATLPLVEKLKVLQCKCFAAKYDFITAETEAILFSSRIHKLALGSSLGTLN